MVDGTLKIVLPSNAEFEKNRLLESETQKKIKAITTELGVELKDMDVTLEDIGDITQDKDVKSAAELFGAKIKE
ncbi:MAG: hypothetical protein R2883_07830 [Caldisericia bacterium]